jgi:hypothetical protein
MRENWIFVDGRVWPRAESQVSGSRDVRADIRGHSDRGGYRANTGIDRSIARSPEADDSRDGEQLLVMLPS